MASSGRTNSNGLKLAPDDGRLVGSIAQTCNQNLKSAFTKRTAWSASSEVRPSMSRWNFSVAVAELSDSFSNSKNLSGETLNARAIARIIQCADLPPIRERALGQLLPDLIYIPQKGKSDLSYL